MNIQKLRLDKGWSQEDLAMHSGISVRTIQRIENGKRASLESLKCLAAVFETSVSNLVQEKPMTNTQVSDQHFVEQAEQDAMRLVFVIQQAKLEAERKIIESEGERDAQLILAEGLTPEIIQIRSIEAFKELSKSANSKVIITDGKTPLLIQPQE